MANDQKPVKLAGTPWDSIGDKLKPLKITPKYRTPYKGEGSTLPRLYLPTGLVQKVITSFDGGDALIKSFQSQPYISFILEGVVESFEDKFQITETLGNSYAVFGIGKKPHVFSFRGSLLNTEEYNWRIQFIYLFEKYLSISRLARFGKAEGDANNFVTVTYDSMSVSGAMLNLQTSVNAANEMVCPFSFSLLAPKIAASMKLQDGGAYTSFPLEAPATSPSSDGSVASAAPPASGVSLVKNSSSGGTTG